MYEYIRGMVVAINDHSLIIDIGSNGSIGYRITASQSTKSMALPYLHQKTAITVFTECIIREESHTLYGFSSEEERALFIVLLSISGIGPKLALQIVNHATVNEVVRAICQSDISWLSSISGIGKKTAERLCLEARDKAALLIKGEEFISSSKKPQKTSSIHSQTIESLTHLGLSETEATQCVQDTIRALQENGEEEVSDVTRLIQLALLHRKKKPSRIGPLRSSSKGS